MTSQPAAPTRPEAHPPGRSRARVARRHARDEVATSAGTADASSGPPSTRVEIEAQDGVRIEHEPATFVGGQVGAQDLADDRERRRQVEVVVERRRRTGRGARGRPADSGAAGACARSATAESSPPKPAGPVADPAGRSPAGPAVRTGGAAHGPSVGRRSERGEPARGATRAPTPRPPIDASE